MNTNQLSKRLAAVAGFVPANTMLADIGSDHAYLPCYLVNKGVIQKAVAGEVVKGPFESAQRNVAANELSECITVRLADGLHAIEEQDGIETVTIAGMGGTLIASILEAGKDRLQSVTRIIAQPNIHAVAVRKWAAANDFQIVNEKILEEDDKIYEIIVLERGIAEYDAADFLVGPFLRKEQSDVFRKKWQRELREWQRVLESLSEAAETNEIQQKKQAVETKYKMVRKVLEN